MTLKKQPLYYPVLVLFALVLVALSSLAFYTVLNLHREEQLMTEHLTSMGLLAIESIESSVAVSSKERPWQKQQLQNLFEKFGQQENIVYLHLVSPEGRIAMSSDYSLNGRQHVVQVMTFSDVRVDSAEAVMVLLGNQKNVFEVRKQFLPHDVPPSVQTKNTRVFPELISGEFIIIVGMTTADFYAALAEDTRRAIGSGLVLLLLAFSSAFFAFIIQKYYTTNKSLKTAESFIRNVIENMGHGLVALDVSGKIVTINRKACRLLREDEKTAVDRDFFEIMKNVDCTIDKTQILQENWTEKKVRCTTAGHTTPISLTTRRIHDQEDCAAGTVILMRDLQEIEALEERVKRSERLASLGQMAAVIAHEVRNPLGSIKGLAQYFARKFEHELDEKKYAEAIINETDRLNRVVVDLLDFARPHEPTYRRCTMAGIVGHALELVRADLEAKQILIEHSREEDVPVFEADPDLLAQVLMNLFLNAVEAMNMRGTLSIRCRYLAESEMVQTQVEDNGTGIPPAAIGKVFDPFFTLKKDGTGLGLALVHRIIENHSGSIEVTAAPGKGTIFTIKLPVKI